MKCIKCGADLSDQASFCPECGSKVEQVNMLCSNCGAVLPPNAKFCESCGAPAEITESAEKKQQEDIAIASENQEESDVNLNSENSNEEKEEPSNIEAKSNLSYEFDRILEELDEVIKDSNNKKEEKKPNEGTAFSSMLSNVGTKISDIWKNADTFTKFIIVLSVLTFLQFSSAMDSYYFLSKLCSFLQIAGLVCSYLIHTGKLHVKQSWIKNALMGLVVVLFLLNLQGDYICLDIENKMYENRKINVPYSSSECIDKSHTEVKNKFNSAGFYDVTEESIPDLEYSQKSKVGTVQSVTINNSNKFGEDSKFRKTAKIVIKYHLLKNVLSPFSSDEAKEIDPKELVKSFKEAGFGSIKTEEVFDLDPDTSEKKYINDVTIGGSNTFNTNKEFPVDTEIKIVTHKPFKKCSLKIAISFISNTNASEYDVNYSFNDENKKLSYGEDVDFEYSLKPGKYTLALTSDESPSVKGEIEIDVSEDMEVNYKISCGSKKIFIVNEEEKESEELKKQIEEIEEAVAKAEKSVLRSDYEQAIEKINNIIEDPHFADYIEDWQSRMETVLATVEENEKQKEQEEIQAQVEKIKSLLSKASSSLKQTDYDNAKKAIDSLTDDPKYKEYIYDWQNELSSIKKKIDEDAKIVSKVVYPDSSSKLGRDYDSKSGSTTYYFNVDGTRNKPSLKKWGSATVTDGVYDYFKTLEGLGLNVTVTSTKNDSPYAGFKTYESYFKASNSKISWKMYLMIQDEDYIEYEFDITA